MNIIILAGGRGDRLWPLCNPPKQFQFFDHKLSLLQRTIERFLPHFPASSIWIVTQKEYASVCKAQSHAIDPALCDQVLVEETPKNTANALLFALQAIEKKGALADSFLSVPSDHCIPDPKALMDYLPLAKKEASKRNHVLFGIEPKGAKTSFGYIVYAPCQELPFLVESFIEKPPLREAKALLEKKSLWNSGITLFCTKTFLKQVPSAPIESVDRAILENAPNLKVIPLDFDWSDLGSWEGVYEAMEKDEHQNVILGSASVSNTKNCLVISSKKERVQIDGLENKIVIASNEGLLIRPK